MYVYYLIITTLIYFDESGLLKNIEIIVIILIIWSHIMIKKTEPGPIKIKKTPIILMKELNYNNLTLI